MQLGLARLLKIEQGYNATHSFDLYTMYHPRKEIKERPKSFPMWTIDVTYQD
jgi:hypothetical protein